MGSLFRSLISGDPTAWGIFGVVIFVIAGVVYVLLQLVDFQEHLEHKD